MLRVYIAATRQNDGKTMACMGLLGAFRKRFDKVGYMKPVGQQYLEIEGNKIDKDAVLMQRIFQLPGDLPDMSPIAISRGFTEEYIVRGRRSAVATKIVQAFRRHSRDKDVMVLEGTGHAGVGSVFDMSNADVAKLLRSKVVLVSGGGIGRPIDEIMLNLAKFERHRVEVVGAIINKVEPDKYEKIDRLVRLGLRRKHIPVFGVVPYTEVLSQPTMKELMEDLDGELISGRKRIMNPVGRMVIGSMPPHDALEYFSPQCLLIVPGNRDDLILTAISTSSMKHDVSKAVCGIVMTCGIHPHPNIARLIKHTDIPMVVVKDDTYDTAAKINRAVFKVRPEDTGKIQQSMDLVERYVDIDQMIDAIEP